MTLTAGVLSQVSVASTSDSLSSTAASGGTAPYTQQWYRSTASGFSPGAGNLISGATALTLNDTGLIPNTQYYYKVVYTDSTSATVTSAQLAVATTAPQLNPNQFDLTEFLGSVDMRISIGTVSCQVDYSQATPLVFGQAVQLVQSAGGPPKVVACAADSGGTYGCFGFVVYNIKNTSFPAGSMVEVASAGNFIYLYATTAIARQQQVTLDLTTIGGVGALVTSSGASIVGYAFDQASAPGALIRIRLTTPSYAVA